jgi:hypothetical protein
MPYFIIFSSMMHVKCVAYFLILANHDDDDDESISSNESLSIEFPPPPSAFSTPEVIDNACQFVPVKNPFVQTTIIRSDSGKNKEKRIFFKQFYSFQFYFIAPIIIINLVGVFFSLSFACFVVTILESALCLFSVLSFSPS